MENDEANTLELLGRWFYPRFMGGTAEISQIGGPTDLLLVEGKQKFYISPSIGGWWESTPSALRVRRLGPELVIQHRVGNRWGPEIRAAATSGVAAKQWWSAFSRDVVSVFYDPPTPVPTEEANRKCVFQESKGHELVAEGVPYPVDHGAFAGVPTTNVVAQEASPVALCLPPRGRKMHRAGSDLARGRSAFSSDSVASSGTPRRSSSRGQIRSCSPFGLGKNSDQGSALDLLAPVKLPRGVTGLLEQHTIGRSCLSP
eukprot:TRINITY_DN21522_c0_g1_i1.p1 TRINITY_DN21522_c0_g1~~TRINITY_DN21522_c0_g1_i1.p1  ORF type:complete len:274 (+),score=22.56 TRINITY_DN21522_c0_g1_i1:50-823(+)